MWKKMDVKSAEILLPGSLITITFPSPALQQQVSWVSQLDIAENFKTSALDQGPVNCLQAFPSVKATEPQLMSDN